MYHILNDLPVGRPEAQGQLQGRQGHELARRWRVWRVMAGATKGHDRTGEPWAFMGIAPGALRSLMRLH